jgi:hypothetical protein
VKLTRTPALMERSDVERLQSIGLTDQQVLSTVAITGYFNFMNRLANSLGVEIPEGRQEAMAGWLSPKAQQAQPWLLQPESESVPTDTPSQTTRR